MRRCLLLLLTFMFALLPAASAQRYIGSISLVPYNFAPLGSLMCDGSLLPITGNDALFNLIGTTYGGDGQTTFALPDCRGRVVIGMVPGPVSNYILGQRAGQETVTLTVSQIPAHTHTAMASTSFGNTVSPASAYWAPRSRTFLFSAPSNLVNMAPGALAPAGGSQPHDNLKPYLSLNYVVWVEGIFPSRD
jgi:microcystin-dependent protein